MTMKKSVEMAASQICSTVQFWRTLGNPNNGDILGAMALAFLSIEQGFPEERPDPVTRLVAAAREILGAVPEEHEQ
jgi:hypothetical protein